MATILDVPTQYRPVLRVLNKCGQKIIDILADTTVGITPQHKTDRIAKIHSYMQEAVTAIETSLLAEPLESNVDTEVAKTIEED